MNSTLTLKAAGLVILASLLLPGTLIAAEDTLFRIGQADNNTAEFALGPNRSNQYATAFARDAIYVVGQSDPKQDWPYIHPGPADAWAGSKSHTVTILFGVESAPAQGTCTLYMDLVDTHSGLPPQLHIKVNGTLFEKQLPRGAGDASAFGEVEKGREYQTAIEFPARLLKTGTNTITIANVRGSWFLYDCVWLTAPASVALGALTEVNELLDVHTQPFLVKHRGKLCQPVFASVLHIGEPVEATIGIEGLAPVTQTLQAGYKTIQGLVPAVNPSRSPPSASGRSTSFTILMLTSATPTSRPTSSRSIMSTSTR